MQNFFVKLLFVTALFIGNVAFSQEKEGEPTDKKSEIKAYIQHHLQDSHDFNLFSSTDENGEVHHYGFPLPVILWDDGLKVFSSSKFNHGETLAEVDGNTYKLYHSKIYKTGAEGTIN